MLTAALAGVEALAPALALELAPVRVNAVTPGLIDTPLLYNTYGPERDTIVQNRAAMLPGKRIGTAEEVAQAFEERIEMPRLRRVRGRCGARDRGDRRDEEGREPERCGIETEGDPRAVR